MTEQEKIPSFTEALSLYLSGEKVEMKESGADNWYKMTRDCLNNSVLDLMSCEYRKKPEKKTRLMKAEELKGKWIKRADVKEMVVRIVDDEIETVLQGPRGVEYFHKLGWTLEDGSPLTVEVSE